MKKQISIFIFLLFTIFFFPFVRKGVKKIILWMILAFGEAVGQSGWAQDIHFSQFYQSPLLLNPALTGSFKGNIRASGNYKDQWGSMGTPYKTSAFSVDASLLKEKFPGSILGVGIQFFNDKAGDSNLGLTQGNLSLSAIIGINDNQKISAGISGGIGQRSINTSNPALKWDNQFNGQSYNSSIPGEIIPVEPQLSPDISAGLAWNFGKESKTLSSGDNIKINAGVAMHHINRPKQTYVTNEKEYSKLVLHTNGYIGLKNTWLAILPSVAIFKQGPSQEISYGLLARYTIKEESKYTGIFKESAVYAGVYNRLKDAVMPTVMFEMANYSVGVSYDVNISQLKAATSTRGGIEISLRYVTPNPFSNQRAKVKSVRFL